MGASSTHIPAHLAITPFEVVYGRPPPTIRGFLPGQVRAQAVAEELQARDDVLAHLKHHLGRAQQKMTRAANQHRREVEFKEGDFVYLKFRPYRQSTLFQMQNRKLALRYFGPFRIISRIGPVAYKLQLPAEARIHPVFHISLLKKSIGTSSVQPSLPDDLLPETPPYLPERVLDKRSVMQDGVEVEQVLVAWAGLTEDDATWIDVNDMRGQFPYFSLADKAVSTEGAIDIDRRRPWQVYRRGSRKVANYGQAASQLEGEKEV
ncbi:hypothetical protein SASPL_154218 [Salvia splendens]|uniref:Chromo domain-containing protein n=1 Tax=Salvia splendens TaxID=180675 RepID=A0A8X8VZQ1_SALSN|nr:hypothetical protein SASPL_154218 [Salvia splendens]